MGLPLLAAGVKLILILKEIEQREAAVAVEVRRADAGIEEVLELEEVEQTQAAIAVKIRTARRVANSQSPACTTTTEGARNRCDLHGQRAASRDEHLAAGPTLVGERRVVVVADLVAFDCRQRTDKLLNHAAADDDTKREQDARQDHDSNLQ